MTSKPDLNPYAKAFVPDSSLLPQRFCKASQSLAIQVVYSSLEHRTQTLSISPLGRPVKLLSRNHSQKRGWAPQFPSVKEEARLHSTPPPIQANYLKEPKSSARGLPAPQDPIILSPAPIHKNSISKDKETLKEIRTSIEELQGKDSPFSELERLEKLEDLSMVLEMLISKFAPPRTLKKASLSYGKDALGFVTTIENTPLAILRTNQDLMKEAKALKEKIDQPT